MPYSRTSLFILYVIVCICLSQTSNPSLPHPPSPLATSSLLVVNADCSLDRPRIFCSKNAYFHLSPNTLEMGVVPWALTELTQFRVRRRCLPSRILVLPSTFSQQWVALCFFSFFYFLKLFLYLLYKFCPVVHFYKKEVFPNLIFNFPSKFICAQSLLSAVSIF